MKKLSLIVLLFTGYFSLFASAKNATPELTQIFQQAVSNETVPGISVAVANKNGIEWAQAFGYADLENKVPLSIDHKMRIGSVAKLIATAGLMRLYEQGKVDLDKAVKYYVPLWPTKHPTMTLRQLTSHTAGIRHYNAGEFLSNEQYHSVDSSLAIFKNDPLVFKPGKGHRYSTYAWSLISAATEGADGERNYREIIQQEVFAPLAMNDSSFDDQYKIIANRPRPYSYENGELINSPQTDHSYKWAGGGFIASPSDVSRFAVAHLTNDYLKPETVEAMFTKAKTDDGVEVNFGIGWMVGFERYKQNPRYKNDTELMKMMSDMPNVVMHSGGSMGGITMMILCRDSGRAVTVVKNVDGERSVNVFKLALKTLHSFHQKDKFSASNKESL